VNYAGYTGSALCIGLTLAAWLACGLYFIASAFRTQRIQKRESKGARTWDSVLLWGGYLVVFVQGRAGSAWNRPFIAPAWAHPACVAGTAIALAGLAYTIWARATLGRYWSRIVAVKQDHKLITHGPYRNVRHPLYLGLLAATLGTGLVFGLWRALFGIAILWTGFIYRAYREDSLMAQQFGAEFAAYRARSGRLLPRRAAG